MKDRHGNRICIGWAAHEVLWLEVAALGGHTDFKDLADMTGRSLYSCYAKLRRLKNAQFRRELQRPIPRAVITPCIPTATKAILRPVIVSKPLPTTIRELTAYEKMTGRSSKRVPLRV